MDREKNIVKHLCIMIFSVMFSNNILYQLKNWYIVKNIGKEILPILANLSFIIIIPIIFFYGYFTNHFSLEKVFQKFLISFLLILILIMFVFIPNKEYFAFKISTDYIDYTKSGIEYIKMIMLKILSQWPFIILYFLSEYWSSLLYTISIWNIINTIFNINQAKKYYHYFGMASTAGMMSSGILALLILKFLNTSNIKVSDSIGYYLIFPVIAASCLAYYSSRQIIYYKINVLRQNHLKLKETKTSLGFIATIKHIFSSQYLQIILIFSLFLGMLSINMEYIFQPIIEEFHKSINPYTDTISSEKYHLEILLFISFITFLISTFVNIICKISLNKFGWSKSAMVIPITIFIGSIIILISRENQYIYTGQLSMIILVLINSVRYSFADILPEILYQPLDKENQSKGKACVKASAKLGKFLNSALLALITLIFRGMQISFSLITIFIISIFIFVIIIVAKNHYNILAKKKELTLIT